LASPARRAAARFLAGFALVCIAAALLENPWVARVLQGPAAADRADVLRGFALWSSAIAALALVFAARISRGPSLADRLALLFTVLALSVLGDRWLLAKFGLPLWEHDPELGYRQRPNAVRSLASFGRPNDVIRIDAYGFHDTDFPRAKPEGELRILALGDSVTQGYGLPYRETFSAALERLLAKTDRSHHSFQVIDAGVHGYSTYQELGVLKRNLDLDPDLILVNFVLNDVTEPFVTDRKFGGTGLDYHGVTETGSAISGWLANETGVGRLVQMFAARGKTLQAEKRLEVYNVRHMAEASREDPAMREAWRIILAQLDELYALAQAHQKPVLLVVFPFTFQLASPALRAPQQIVTADAADHDVPVLDLTSDFAAAVFDDPEITALLERKGYGDDERLAFYRWKVEQYFFDEDHLTPKSHELVAEKLLAYLEAHGFAHR
jgi:lysophospholipase L1-like esterase